LYSKIARTSEYSVKVDMRARPDNTNDLARALRIQVDSQAEIAKRAIREYKKSLLDMSNLDDAQRLARQREVHEVVQNYLRLRKRLDELVR